MCNPKPNRSCEEDFVFVSFLKGLPIRPKGRAEIFNLEWTNQGPTKKKEYQLEGPIYKQHQNYQ